MKVVTKDGFLRSKWWHSASLKSDGVDGNLEIVKRRVMPANSCMLTLQTQGDNAGGDWALTGIANISK